MHVWGEGERKHNDMTFWQMCIFSEKQNTFQNTGGKLYY